MNDILKHKLHLKKTVFYQARRDEIKRGRVSLRDALESGQFHVNSYSLGGGRSI